MSSHDEIESLRAELAATRRAVDRLRSERDADGRSEPWWLLIVPLVSVFILTGTSVAPEAFSFALEAAAFGSAGLAFVVLTAVVVRRLPRSRRRDDAAGNSRS